MNPSIIFFQQGGPSVTNQFFDWFYNGLGGLGGWFLFFLLAVAAVIFLLYDSNQRYLRATGWRLAVILTACLMIPAIIWRFSSIDVRQTLVNFTEAIWYLGLLGGIVPVVLAVGYYVTYQGMVGCIKGHPPYESVVGECPECAREKSSQIVAPAPLPGYQGVVMPAPQPSAPRQPLILKPELPKTAAWMTASDGHTYQLNQGETTIGRGSDNHIQLSGDRTVSRHHAKVVEQNGHFKIYDLGSESGTKVNGHIIRQPMLLETNDEICLGDNITMRFKQ